MVTSVIVTAKEFKWLTLTNQRLTGKKWAKYLEEQLKLSAPNDYQCIVVNKVNFIKKE